jgi:hypothetical protein
VRCAKEGCSRSAQWRPVVVVLRVEARSLRFEVPVNVCDVHRRSVRTLLARRGVPALERKLEERHVSLRSAIYRVEFRPLM